MISTSEQHVKHPFAGRKRQQKETNFKGTETICKNEHTKKEERKRNDCLKGKTREKGKHELEINKKRKKEEEKVKKLLGKYVK